MEQEQILIRVKVIKDIEDAEFEKNEIVYMTEKEVDYYKEYVIKLDIDPIQRFATEFKDFHTIEWGNIKNFGKDDE